MRRVRLAAALLAVTLAAAAGAAVPPQMNVALIASSLDPRPGSTILVGFRMTPRPGWHGYWSNAGGSGIAPSVNWTAPPGVLFGPLLHPAPTLLKSMGVVSYVHAGQHIIVSRMTVPARLAPGAAIPVRAELNFAVCSENLCVPGHSTFSLAMIGGSGSESADAAALRKALARVPANAAGGTYWSGNGDLTLQLPSALRLRAGSTRFFPDDNGFFDPSAARVANGEPLRIVSPLKAPPPARITGVVSDGGSSYRIAFARSAAPIAANRPPPPQQQGQQPQVLPPQRSAPETQAANHGAKSPSRTQPRDNPHPGWLLWAALAAAAGAFLLLFGRRS